MEENKEATIEESFEALEEIITKLESGDVTLDESFSLYKEGMEKLQSVRSKIEETKKAVMAIAKDGELEVFEEEE